MSSTIAQISSDPGAAAVRSRVLVAAPAPLGSGGLGTAAAEFLAGAEALGCDTGYVGPQAPGALSRLTSNRVFRRAFGMSTNRAVEARAVRHAVPSDGWDLLYGISGSVPVELPVGFQVVHQSTRHPAVEWRKLRIARRETGGRGGSSWIEVRRREREIDRADLIHVTSRSVRDEFLEAGVPESRLVHAYLGVDLDRFRPGPKPETPRIAFVGPLSMQKGVDLVADLAERLSGDAVVEAVGGPSCPWSRRVVDGARFETCASVPELLARSHLLVLPSRSDGFGYVVLEALASGSVPIVTPEVGSAEVVRRLDERLVIPREEFAERTAELLPLLDLPELARRGRALAEEFDRKKTSKAMAAAVLERAGLSCAS
jgi:glycosyltransferase involved in cell wall biosynthesis